MLLNLKYNLTLNILTAYSKKIKRMFLYFAYKKNDYNQEFTYKYNNTFQKKYINDCFITINMDEDIGNNQRKRSNLNPQVDWDIEKGNPEEYYAYLMQTDKKKLSLLIPINTGNYNTLCDEEKVNYAELVEPYYEDTFKQQKSVSSFRKRKNH
jgi:hypothetical protein